MKREDVYRAFGAKLSVLRRRVRLSQSDLGRLVGLSRTSITNIETGRQAVQLHQVLELAAILDVAVTDLLPEFPEQSGVSNKNVDEFGTQGDEGYVEKLKRMIPTISSDKA